MPRMTSYNCGDVILVNFVFSDETGEKRRPAIILSSDAYHKSRQEVIISAITSQIERVLVGDYLINGWKSAGLLFPSVATGIIRTIKQEMIYKKLGKIPQTDLKEIKSNLKIILGLK
jgi:mRNA interferase MazF